MRWRLRRFWITWVLTFWPDWAVMASLTFFCKFAIVSMDHCCTEGFQPSWNISFFSSFRFFWGFFGLDALKHCYYQCHMLKTSYFFGFWWKTATPKKGIPRFTYLRTFKMSLYTLNEKMQSRGLFCIKSNAWKYIWMMEKNA